MAPIKKKRWREQLHNYSAFLTIYAASYPRTPEFSSKPLRELQISHNEYVTGYSDL
jgi:hypothetical protein